MENSIKEYNVIDNYINNYPFNKGVNFDYIKELEKKINIFNIDTKYYSVKAPRVRVVGYVR